MNFHLLRRQALVRDLKKDGLDAHLVTNPVNVQYLSGFTGGASYLAVTARSAVLISDSRFTQQIREECPDLEAHVRSHTVGMFDAVADVLTKLGAKAIGLEAGHATLAVHEALAAAAPKCTFAGFKDKVEELRAIKDASEVEAIRAAVRVAERAFHMFQATMREADTEKDLVDAMEMYVRRAGGECTAFATIAAIGDRGALPHAVPTNRPLGAGSKVLIDWGAVLNGYRCDLTRTFRSPFQVSPSRKNKQERTGHDFEEIYDVVLRAQSAARAAVRDGVPAKEVDAAARDLIAAAGYGDYFTHGLGHGIGLETHEAPRVRHNSDDVLRAGMVITLEPGIYIPGWGGVRIEDDVLVKRDEGTFLTGVPRLLAELEG